MKKSPSRQLFEKANQLWFIEGRTNKALEMYKKALKINPEDPVILYQTARVMWAFCQSNEAMDLIKKAEQHMNRLNKFGKEILYELKQKVLKLKPLTFDKLVQVKDSEMDMEHLKKMNISAAQWSRISIAAKERDMFGLAFCALQHSSGPFLDFDLAKDQHEALYEAELNMDLLDEMDTEPDYNDQKNLDKTIIPPLSRAKPVEPDKTIPVIKKHTSLAPELTRPKPAAIPQTDSYPLRLDISVTPQQSIVGEKLFLKTFLKNVSQKSAAVNKRLLLNRSNVPAGYGEIFLNVEGPPEYQNQVRFNIRAGLPDKDQFDLLAPNESIEKSYQLWKYESFHVPGTYKIWITYQNTVECKVKNIPVFTGTIISNPVKFNRILYRKGF